jgi:hypothetical protein
MIEWARILNESPVDWLLERSNPSVRYLTQRDILGKLDDDPEVIATKKAISGSATVQRILRKQKPEGYWERPESPYLPKYKSSYWTIIVLGWLGLDRTDAKVAKACEFIFQFQQDDGGFSSESTDSASREYEYRRQKDRKLPLRREFVPSLIFESQLSCLTGNMAAALIRMGYADDPRLKKAVEWLVRVQNRDGGWLCPYWRAHTKDKHGCFMGTVCSLEALSEVPMQRLTNEMSETISRGAEFLLIHRLFKADHHDYATINKAWLQLSFPWFAGYNILRGLDVLTKLGYVRDDRLNDAVEVLIQKRQGNGTWILENSPEGRMQANIESKGESSKWITMLAVRVLKRLSMRMYQSRIM